jgi:hypothetical protein
MPQPSLIAEQGAAPEPEPAAPQGLALTAQFLAPLFAVLLILSHWRGAWRAVKAGREQIRERATGN